MKKIFIALALLSLTITSCFLSDDCELSEKYTPSITLFVLDKGFELYEFKVAFNQIVEIYMGDCASDKYRNETKLQITSRAPCDQTINFTIDVNMGPDSYQIKEDGIAIKANETIDFGIVKNGGSRIDYAEIDIAIYCAKCPGDE